MPTGIIVAICILFIFSFGYFIFSYRRHTLGLDAPERKLDVMILDKQSNKVIGAHQVKKMKNIGFTLSPLPEVQNVNLWSVSIITTP